MTSPTHQNGRASAPPGAARHGGRDESEADVQPDHQNGNSGRVDGVEVAMESVSRRTLLALAALPAIGLIAAACGERAAAPSPDSTGPDVTDPEVTAPGPTAPPDGAQAMGNTPRRRAAATEAGPAAASLNTLGADLYSRLAAAGAANLVFSPASVAVALSMTLAGARGQTATEMADVLHLADPAAIHPAMNALTAELESRTGTFSDGGGEPADVVLAVANSLWGQSDYDFEAPFLDLLSGEYGAPMHLVDYTTASEQARQAINAWVDSETRERIPELLPAGAVDNLTRLVLVNAVYLKAAWLFPFPEAATADGSFTTVDGSQVEVPMMSIGDRFAYGTGDGWQALELPYVGDSLAMLLVLPDSGELATGEAALADGLLDDVVAALATRPVRLTMPKFDIGTTTSLDDALQALGMPTAFVAGVADFTAMTTQEQLYISTVAHAANITVDEAGSEAAAATAVAIGGTTADPDPPVELTLDRPFLFALRDRPTGAITFLGRVGDPSQTR